MNVRLTSDKKPTTKLQAEIIEFNMTEFYGEG